MNKATYKELLDEKEFIVITPVGKSMLPMLRERFDTVKLVKPNELKKYDVVLYKTRSDEYILHRIVAIKDESYVLCGDNNLKNEYGITKEMIIGVMEGYFKGEKYIPKNSFWYKVYYRRIIFLKSLKMVLIKMKNVFIKK